MSAVAKIERTHAQAAERLAADQRTVEELTVAVAAGEEQLEQIAVAEARDQLDAPAAQKRARELEARILSSRAELQQRQRVIRQREVQLTELEAAIADARRDEADQELARLCEKQRKSATAWNDTVAASVAAERRLSRDREAVEKARLVARELGGGEWPANADEPDLPDGAARVAELIAEGPRQPLAKSAAAGERLKREAAQRDRNEVDIAVRDALRDGQFDRVERLRPELRPLAATNAASQAEAFLAELEHVSGDELDVRGQPDRQRETIRRRLERIRALERV